MFLYSRPDRPLAEEPDCRDTPTSNVSRTERRSKLSSLSFERKAGEAD